MTATLLDGRALAAKIRDEVRGKVDALRRQGTIPKLATILVGDDPASRIYLGSKHNAAEEVRIESENHTLPAGTGEAALAKLIDQLNADSSVNGILLQLPLPSHLNSRSMIERISPAKDVDGLTSANMGRLFYGDAFLVPCTPKGVMALLHNWNVPIRGAHAVIINRSSLVGKPLYHLLLSEDATVTTCHSKSRDLSSLTKQADILVSAVGHRPRFTVTADMVKDGAAVVDVAMNRLDGKLVGDVDFPSVSDKVSFITPVPGGVGPMTVVMLLENTVIATSNQARRKLEVLKLP